MLMLSVPFFMHAQQSDSPEHAVHSLSAKILFQDYGLPNGIDDLALSNGLEVSYIRNFSPYFNLALPLKIGLANVEGFTNKRTIYSVDAVLQAQYYKPEAFLVPYVFAGGGVASEELENASVQFPLGLGLNLRVGPNSFINLQGEYRVSMEEDRSNLQYGIGYVFRVGPQVKDPSKMDSDGDGISDLEDKCPKERGPASLLGCPDSDGDTVADMIDACPDEPGPPATLGCPDKDEDGTPDKDDKCPDEAGDKENDGCPDTDADDDGVEDDQDACPDEAGPASLMGCPDRDEDGTPDKDDNCPDEFGPKSNKGCPQNDTDGDGILDKLDACPDEAGPLESKGCPDRDGDGVADKDDQCPDKAGAKESNGCPNVDSDGDGILDGDDDCPEKAGSKAFNGCPDTDGDGVGDQDDKCPNEVGNKENDGCPDLDPDKDGVNIPDDECPDEAGPAETNGCPDADGDWVADKDDKCPDVQGIFDGCPDTDGDKVGDADDKCPNTPGTLANAGCPEIKEEEKKYLEFATQAVKFETGESMLLPESFAVLDTVATILNNYPDYKVRIVGHTDDVGRTTSNLQLSKSRAQACFNYFLSRGLSRERMIFEGKGESEPIADNDTEEGRELNRRVEFELYIE
jgi:outer membrane protein OmpA-like peptidoglycan-associated protein